MDIAQPFGDLGCPIKVRACQIQVISDRNMHIDLADHVRFRYRYASVGKCNTVTFFCPRVQSYMVLRQFFWRLGDFLFKDVFYLFCRENIEFLLEEMQREDVLFIFFDIPSNYAHHFHKVILFFHHLLLMFCGKSRVFAEE